MFWQRCIDANCVIVPLKVYSEWNTEGRISEQNFIGIKFAAIPIDPEVAGPDYYFLVEESLADDYPRFDTPEAALEEYESRK